MKHTLHGLMGALALTMAFAAPLLAEETVLECQQRVIDECAEVLEDASWWEKPAIGVVCTARLLGCAGTSVTIRVF